MKRADRNASQNDVDVLVGFLAMTIDSDTLISKATTKLVADVKAIPARYAKVLDADARVRRRWKNTKSHKRSDQ